MQGVRGAAWWSKAAVGKLCRRPLRVWHEHGVHLLRGRGHCASFRSSSLLYSETGRSQEPRAHAPAGRARAEHVTGQHLERKRLCVVEFEGTLYTEDCS